MATRMATLLYGEKPNADIQAGNRADTVDDIPAAAPLPPPALPPSSGFVSPSANAALPTTVPLVPPVGPNSPSPSPWVRREPFALRGMVRGLAAAGVLFAGLTLFAIALAWASSLTTVARVSLMVLGGYLISLGVAWVITTGPEARPASA